MLIYVIRHGETELNVRQVRQGWLDAPLNQAGRDLARLTGQALRNIHFDGCFSSPLIRARETVEIVLRESGNADVPIQTDDRLKEINFGEEEGLPATACVGNPEEEKLFFTDAFRFPGFPGGESIQDLCERTGSFMRELIEKEAYENVLIGAHGCALRAMLNPYYDHPEHFWQGRVALNCSVSILEASGGKARLLESDKVYYDRALIVDHYQNIVRN